MAQKSVVAADPTHIAIDIYPLVKAGAKLAQLADLQNKRWLVKKHGLKQFNPTVALTKETRDKYLQQMLDYLSDGVSRGYLELVTPEPCILNRGDGDRL